MIPDIIVNGLSYQNDVGYDEAFKRDTVALVTVRGSRQVGDHTSIQIFSAAGNRCLSKMLWDSA